MTTAEGHQNRRNTQCRGARWSHGCVGSMTNVGLDSTSGCRRATLVCALVSSCSSGPVRSPWGVRHDKGGSSATGNPQISPPAKGTQHVLLATFLDPRLVVATGIATFVNDAGDSILEAWRGEAERGRARERPWLLQLSKQPQQI